MDILEQVEKILLDNGVKVTDNRDIYEIVKGLMFVDIAEQYNECVENNQLREADECLQGIARLIISARAD